MKVYALKSTRQKAAVPLPRGDRLILRAAHGSQHNEAGQVTALAAQPVSDPRTHAGPAGNERTGVHERVRRVVVDLLCGHRADDADFIRDPADVRQCAGDRLAGLAEVLKLMLRPEAFQLLLALKLGNRLAVGDRLGHRLAVHLGELRLVVERLKVRRPAGHAEVNHPLGPGREVQRIDHAKRRALSQAAGIQHRAQRE